MCTHASTRPHMCACGGGGGRHANRASVGVGCWTEQQQQKDGRLWFWGVGMHGVGLQGGMWGRGVWGGSVCVCERASVARFFWVLAKGDFLYRTIRLIGPPKQQQKKKKQHNAMNVCLWLWVTLKVPTQPISVRPIMAVEPRRRAQSGIRSPFETKAQTRGPPECVSNSPPPSSQNDPMVPVSIELLMLSPPCGRTVAFLGRRGGGGSATEKLTRRPQTGHENSGPAMQRGGRGRTHGLGDYRSPAGRGLRSTPVLFLLSGCACPLRFIQGVAPSARPPACKCCRRIDPD